MISERTMRVLEFTRIRELLAEGALTEAGAAKCRELTPADDLASAAAAQAETEEATVILQYIGGHPMISFPDVRPSLGVCDKGGTLSAGMLLSVAEMLRAARAARDALVTGRTPPFCGQRRKDCLSRGTWKRILRTRSCRRTKSPTGRRAN